MSSAPLDLPVLRARLAARDEARPEAVAAQHGRGELTARERAAAIVDEGSFVEYGILARPADPTLEGPADGVVVGVGRLAQRPVAVISYDYTVMGGSQGHLSHLKVDRLLDLAGRHLWPVVIFTEGGGARAQELNVGFGHETTTFVQLARLSGRVPILCGVAGRAFAGHANLSGLADFVVATRNSSLGIAGPPLVENATGERLTPEEIGRATLHAEVGAVDVLADDDHHAIELLRTYLSLFEDGRAETTEPALEPEIDRIVPDSPRAGYDVRRVIQALADGESFLELRAAFAPNLVVGFARIDGWPLSIVANQPLVLAGAIDTPAADKAARMIHLADAFGFPLLYLVDTPGFLVGPQVESTALVRHSARMLHALANHRAPILTVVLRKGYGLAYTAMGSPGIGGSFVVAWPTAEFGGMGLKGAVAILGGGAQVPPGQLEELQRRNRAHALAERFGIDDVVAPSETRMLLANALATMQAPPPPDVRPVDPW